MVTTSNSLHGLTTHKPSTGLGMPSIKYEKIQALIASMSDASGKIVRITIIGR